MPNLREGVVKPRLIKANDPECVRLLVIHDPHLTSISPPAYVADYQAICWQVLRTCFRYARRKRADAILWGGDFFHRKAAHRNPLGFIDECMALLQEAPCPHLGIAGNHDVRHGSWEQGLKGQPLALLIRAGIYHLLDTQDAVIQAPGFSVRVAGGSYHHSTAEHVRAKTKEGADHLVALGHFWWGETSGNFFGEPQFGPDVLDQSEVDVYGIGHHHSDRGVRESPAGKLYLVQGSISRTGSGKDDLSRAPAACLLELTKAGKVATQVRPKYPHAADTMDLEKRAAVKQEEQELDAFIAQLNSQDPVGTDPKIVLDSVDTTQDVRDRARNYLEIAEAQA